MKIKAILISLFCVAMLSGCEEKKPSVATTVYPVQYLVEKIGGDSVTSVVISENEMIQRAQIKSDFKDTLDQSDALFYIGGLEPYMQLYSQEIRDSGVAMVDLATKSAIYKFERYTKTTIDKQTTGVVTPYYEGDAFASLETYENDPLLWMDPVAMTSMASDIRVYLTEKYPTYKEIFDENYNELELSLARLDADFQLIPDKQKSISFVSMTPSFGNWQKSYGIKVYPVSLSKFGALPSSEQLAIIEKRIRNDHVRYMAMEPNLPEDMIKLRQTLIDKLGLIPVKISNLSSLSSEDKKANKDYLTIMYDNVETLNAIAN